MSLGNPPDGELPLYQVNSDSLGSFAPSLREITRLGLNKLRYVKGATRGEQVSVTALHYVQTKTEAIEHISFVEGLQGKEVSLISESTDKNWDIFLMRVRAWYRPVGSTDPNKNFLINYSLELMRTK